MEIRIGTRESKLAMVQTEMVMQLLQARFPDASLVLRSFKTTGDKFLQQRLETIGGKGLFVKEIEEALLNDEIDVAVHSAKDVPSFLPEGLILIGALPRARVHDVLISKYESLETLPEGAVIGTSSPRRESVLRAVRPDLKLRLIRGNVQSRLNKYDSGEFDGILLAQAGLDRLDIHRSDVHPVPLELLLPASGQGIITLESTVDGKWNDAIAEISDDKAFRCLTCERGFLQELDGGCGDPMAAYAEIEGARLRLRAMMEKDGRLVHGSLTSDVGEYTVLGRRLAIQLREGH